MGTQALASDRLDAQASALGRICDQLFRPFGFQPKNPDFSKQVRADVKPFIDASHLLNDSSYGSGLVDQGSWAHGIAVFDANGDGLLDVYITHDNGPPMMDKRSLQGLPLSNKLYINLGNGPDGMPRFLETSAISGVQELGRISHGVSVADYDNDGRLDMYVTNGVVGLVTQDFQHQPPGYQPTYGAYNPGEGRNTLFHNDGNIPHTLPDGRVVQVPIFSDRTELAGVGGGSLESESSTWADIDNDGYVDLYVTNFVDLDYMPFRYVGLGGDRYFGEPNILYHNNGDGTFTDITGKAGVAGNKYPQTNPDFLNANLGNKPPLKDSLGRTVNPSGVLSHHAAWFDYDGDGYPDLFVANDRQPIEVFHNNGDLTFTDVTPYTIFKMQGAWMEIGLLDYDGDGKMDIFASNLGLGAFYTPIVYKNGTIAYTDFLGLFHNDGVEMKNINGRQVPIPKFTWMSDKVMVDWSKILPPVGFTLTPFCHKASTGLSAAKGLEWGEFAWGAIFPDVNNNGRPDLYWVGGLNRCDPNFKTYCLSSPGRLLLNDGNDEFTDVSVEAHVLNIVGVNYQTRDRMNLLLGEIGSGVSYGDLDNNGYPDIIVSDKADYTPYGHDLNETALSFKSKGEVVAVPTFLFMNPGGNNNWLKVRLVGTRSNRAGIGAQVQVTLQDGTVQTKLLLSGDVMSGQTALELLFGLGQSTIVSKVEVKWPSGTVDALQNLGVNKVISITEGTHPAVASSSLSSASRLVISGYDETLIMVRTESGSREESKWMT